MEKEKKKKYYLLIGILTMIISITGATYAYFALTASNNNTISGTAATASLNLSVTKVKPTTEGTDKLVPQLETALGSAINSTNNCVDTIGNKVCQVYQITITNTGTGTATVQGKIAFTGIDNLPHLKWKLLSNATTIDSNQSATTASTTATNIGSSIQLAQNASSNLYFVVWINETNGVQTDSGTFGGTITFTDSNGEGLTSTIGASEPAETSPVDVYIGDTEDRQINTTFIGTPFNNPTSAMNALANYWEIESYPGCIGYKLNGTTIEKGYVVLTITQAMVDANREEYPGMTAGTYYLQGWVDEEDVHNNAYEGAFESNPDISEEDARLIALNAAPVYKSNIEVLKAAFGASNPGCSNLDGSSSSADCYVSGLYANADSNGGVSAYDGNRPCGVYSDGTSHCG